MKSLVAMVLGVALLLPAAVAFAESEGGGADHDRFNSPVAVQPAPGNLGTIAGDKDLRIEPRADQEGTK